MRFMIYFVAVLAAAGIVYTIGNSGSEKVAQSAAEAPTVEPVKGVEAETKSAEGATSLVRLKVPSMHCAVMCYPAVKKSLEGAEGVQSVDLAEQKVEGLIDNPVVLVQASSAFDVERAMAALAEKGYADAELVQ